MMALLSLPVLVLENIFSYLSYDEIARCRLVSRSFNEISMRLLNKGFLMIERRHALALKGVKANLPRRESERRHHPLARHCDILTSIETRISMLNMTYSKFIDNNICCFIPGRVIDEIRRVLTTVETSTTPPRAHEVLQELRDISSMAIEHFDDKISPAFRKKLQDGVKPILRPVCLMSGSLGPIALREEMVRMRRRAAANERLLLFVASQYKKMYKQMCVNKKRLASQSKYIRELQSKQKSQQNCIADMKKHIEDNDIRYIELTHTNQAAGGKAIAATATGEASGSQPLRHFSSQIKLDLSVLPIGTNKRTQNKILPNIQPRKPVINLPTISDDMEATPAPTTPNVAAKTSSLAKIRGITNELRSLSNLSKSQSHKRPLEEEDVRSKKPKRD